MTRTRTAAPAKRLSLLGVLRHGWLVPLTMLACAAIAFGVNEIRSRDVTATSVLLATSKAGPDGPGFATEAAKLALSYTTAIPQDDNVIRNVATSLGRSNQYVRDHLRVSNPTDTAVLRVQFRAHDPSVAAAGARAATEALAGAHPASPAIGAGSLQILRLADRPKKSSDGRILAIGIGLVLGALLGIALLLAWERADPRVDSFDDALGQVGLPASPVESLTPAVAANLLERWSRLADQRPVRVALIPIGGAAPAAEKVAAWLEARSPLSGQGNGSGNSYPDMDEAIVVGTSPPGTDGSAEREALRSDVRVLLAKRGTRERDIDAATALLHQFGAPADWLLVMGAGRKVRSWLTTNGGGPEPEVSEQATAGGARH